MPRPRTPPGATRVELSTTLGEEDVTVTGFLYPASPGRGAGGYSLGEPPEPATLDLLAVTDERGAERPELLPLAEAEIDDLCAQAVEDEAGRRAAAAEDYWDGRRTDRRLGL